MSFTAIRRMRGALVLLAVLLAMAAARPAMAQREPRRPRLVLLVVVDQMRADYLTRYHARFGDGGFRRLMANGAFFDNAYLSYGASGTGPGHATISTGRIPRQHGIVANEWVQGQVNPATKAAFFDPDAKIIGATAKAEGRSPRNLIGPTLGDELKLADRFARVFSVALKDRSAIALGGKRPDGAFWWDANNGQFVTSTYYMKEEPTYVREFNTQRWADRFMNGKWDRLLPLPVYGVTYPIDPEWLTNTEDLGREFPHLIPHMQTPPSREYYTAVGATPYGNEVVFEMSRKILAGERLGNGEGVDMLCVSLSSFDAAGHLFGPQSAEMMDFTLRTDRQLAGFLDAVDRSVGLNRCIVVLTADHGVSTAPRLAGALGMGGGRVDLTAAIKDANTKLSALAPLPDNGSYITGSATPWLFMNPAVNGLDPQVRERIMTTAKESLRALAGVAGVFSGQDLAGLAPPPESVQQYLAWRCYVPGRSGELYLHLAPFWGFKDGAFAEHGTSSNHDRHVPIVIMGGGTRPGRYFTSADPVDIAATVAALLGIEAPTDCAGRVLNEALEPGEWVR